MRILLHVEPGADDRDRFVAWAADLVEAITADMDDAPASPSIEVGVVADLLTCLEIGVVTLGRAAPRTVESGDRHTSPLRLFPFRPTPEGDESRAELASAYECLRELADDGAVEGVSHDGESDEMLPAAAGALLRALEGGEWESVVVLGESEPSRAAILKWSQQHLQTRVVRPMPDEEIHERVAVLLRRVEPDVEDRYTSVRRIAVENAVQFATILEQVGLGR